MSQPPGGERRKWPRRPVHGPIELIPDDPVQEGFVGELIDLSEGGFRASHRNATLRAGAEVRFRHAGGAGTARAVWVRVLPQHVETGFVVVSGSRWRDGS